MYFTNRQFWVSKNASFKKYSQNVFSRKLSWCMEQSLLHNVQRGCRCNQLFIYQTLSSVTTNWLTDVECSTPYVYYTMPIDNKRLVRLLRSKLIRIVKLCSTTFLTVLITTSINVYCFAMFYQCCHSLTGTLLLNINFA